MLKNGIKVIIFDFDDTLYNGQVWTGWDVYINKFFDIYFKDNEKEKIAFTTKYGFVGEPSGRSVAKTMLEEYGSGKPFIDYQTENVFPLDTTNIRVIDSTLIEKITKACTSYIVTNGTGKHVRTHMQNHNIDSKLFKEIFTNSFESMESTKTFFYKQILEREGVKPSEILVVGDHYNNDLIPAKNLGMQTLLAQKIEVIKEYFEPLLA